MNRESQACKDTEYDMNKELAKTIGLAARQARKTLRLTQEDAAERINVSVEFYARIERGTSLPSIPTFARIVSALGVSADALLGRQSFTPQSVPLGSQWTPPAPTESPEMRRLLRRLRKARPATLRLVSLLIKEFERAQSPHKPVLLDGHEPASNSTDSSY